MTTDVASQDGPDQLEAALDEVITHMRAELAHGSWPTSPDDQR